MTKISVIGAGDFCRIWRSIILLTGSLSEVELIVEAIDALSCWTAHVLVMMLYTQE